MPTIASELAKVRANPDYLPPICLGCGREIGKDPLIGIIAGVPIYGNNPPVCYDREDLLCTDCMDEEIIAEAKDLGEWED